MHYANTLVILSDQHNANILGAAGDLRARTPNLDRLARSGTRFKVAYTPSPLCVPARAAMATGRWVHDIGYWDNAIAYDGQIPSWGTKLKVAGVETTAIGKLHYRTAEDDTGFDRQIIPMHIAEGIGQVWGLVRDPLPVRQHGEMIVGTAGPGLSKYNEYDLAIADAAIDWLRDRSGRAAGGPWVLYVGFVAPHFPYVVPQPFFDLFANMPYSRPSLHPEAGYVPHPWVQAFMGVSPGTDRNTPEERARCLRAYYGLCAFLDANIGRILDALDETGLADTTRVIYSSDHGDMMGDRGQWNKSVPYEPSVRIPMIMAGPDIARDRLCETPVNLIDLYATILESAGVAAPHGETASTSLFATAQAQGDPERIQFSEYHAYGAPSAWYMVRCGRWKYIHYLGYAPELFDLDADPTEAVNLAAHPDHREVRDRLHKALLQRLDPVAVDRAAKSDQAKMIDAFGGRERALKLGAPGETPPPTHS